MKQVNIPYKYNYLPEPQRTVFINIYACPFDHANGHTHIRFPLANDPSRNNAGEEFLLCTELEKALLLPKVTKTLTKRFHENSPNLQSLQTDLQEQMMPTGTTLDETSRYIVDDIYLQGPVYAVDRLATHNDILKKYNCTIDPQSLSTVDILPDESTKKHYVKIPLTGASKNSLSVLKAYVANYVEKTITSDFIQISELKSRLLNPEQPATSTQMFTPSDLAVLQHRYPDGNLPSDMQTLSAAKQEVCTILQQEVLQRMKYPSSVPNLTGSLRTSDLAVLKHRYPDGKLPAELSSIEAIQKDVDTALKKEIEQRIKDPLAPTVHTSALTDAHIGYLREFYTKNEIVLNESKGEQVSGFSYIDFGSGFKADVEKLEFFRDTLRKSRTNAGFKLKSSNSSPRRQTDVMDFQFGGFMNALFNTNPTSVTIEYLNVSREKLATDYTLALDMLRQLQPKEQERGKDAALKRSTPSLEVQSTFSGRVSPLTRPLSQLSGRERSSSSDEEKTARKWVNATQGGTAPTSTLSDREALKKSTSNGSWVKE